MNQYPPLAILALGKTTQRVRILRYLQNGRFLVLDSRDERRVVHRSRLTFLTSQQRRERLNEVRTSNHANDHATGAHRRSQGSTSFDLIERQRREIDRLHTELAEAQRQRDRWVWIVACLLAHRGSDVAKRPSFDT